MAQLITIVEVDLPTGDAVPIVRRRFSGAASGSGPRVSIVAGIRGDAPEGIEVAHRVARFLEEVEDQLTGVVDIYPCVNPLAAERGTRHWPFFDLDLNRRFPGKADGHPPDRVAHALVQDMWGPEGLAPTQVIELRGARPAFGEATQAHIRARDTAAVEVAQASNVSVVWCRAAGPAAPATFAHQFPGTLVLEGGVGNRVSARVGKELADGVLNVLSTVGVLPDTLLPFPWAALTRPRVVDDSEVYRVRSNHSGLFLPETSIWAEVTQGQELGRIIDPILGSVLEIVGSPVAGRVLALREQPVVYQGSMVARVVS